MTNDFDFHNYYQSNAGHQLNECLEAKVNSLDLDFFNKQILEIGYAFFKKSSFLKPPEKVTSAIIPKFINQVSTAKKEGYDVLITKDYSLPFQNCTFDVIILNHCIEHFDDFNALLKETWRILADGGHLIIFIPAFFNLWRFSKKMPYYKTKRYFGFVLSQKLLKNKFSEISITSCHHFPTNLLVIKAEKKVFSPILALNEKTEAKSKQKYFAATNCSSNFQE